MTRCTTAGRVQGVIQEVVTDKIHQIAAEKWSGRGGGLLLLPWCCWKYVLYSGVRVQRWDGSRRIWRSATRCLWTRPDYCKQAFTHSSVKPTIIVFKPSEARWAQKRGHWARSCNGFAGKLQMGKILGRPELGRWPVETFFGRPDEDFGLLQCLWETRISRFPRIGELWQGAHRSCQGCGNWVTRRR